MRRAAALAPALLLAACAGRAPEPPAWDIAAGKFLSAEEYAALPGDQARAYCEELASELDIHRDNAEAAASEAASAEPEVQDLQARLAAARQETAALSAEVEELERRLGALRERPASYTVQQDDWLWKIARKRGVYGDARGWERIYEANRDKISDPDLIHPGMVLSIPR